MTTTPPPATPTSTPARRRSDAGAVRPGGGRLRGRRVRCSASSSPSSRSRAWCGGRCARTRRGCRTAPTQIGALLGAIALYGVNTLVRAERWHRLLLDDGAQPARADSYALTVVGYAVNNVLPARAGDVVAHGADGAARECSRRTVLGTLVAERLLDVGVILVLFLVVGYAMLGEVGAGSVEWIALATAAVVAGVAVAIVLVRRNERVHDFVAPMLSSTARAARAPTGRCSWR